MRSTSSPNWADNGSARTMQQRRVNNMPMARQRLRYGMARVNATVAMCLVVCMAAAVLVLL